MGPRDKQISIDEETVEVLEIIENCQDSYDDEPNEDQYYIEQ